MDLDLAATRLDGTLENCTLIGVPDNCPRCHRAVHPKHFNAAILKERSVAQVVYRCTHQKCQELFLATYLYANRTTNGRAVYVMDHVAPIAVQAVPFPELVSTLSPTFVEIFNQSMAAESMQLNQLVGIGLRKALEFIVKDYAVAENPEHEEEIRRTLLGTCITRYVSDVNVKECAKRAAWLGNDETHYTRKWETKDINDLKLLVRLTVNWIENALLTKKYIAEMNAASG